MANNITIADVHQIGPSKIIQLFFNVSNFRAFVVIDNTALGPAVGGVRVSPNVTVEEVARLARTMTLKNSIAGLPYGGGKAGIVADPGHPEIEHCFRLFAKSIEWQNDFIPGPDMGSNERCMAWIKDEIGRAVGLPEEIGGLALDKLGATGYGLAECAEIACKYANIELGRAKVAIQGFGSVGKAAARFFSAKGAIIVAVSDSKGSICNHYGLDIQKLRKVKDESGSVMSYKDGTSKPCEELFSTPCDILIPAATPDVLNASNVDSIKAKLVLQGANIPVTAEAEKILQDKGILSVPDFIANAGGVIMAAMEYAKRSEAEAFEAISERIRKNTRLIIERATAEKVLPRGAAEAIAQERIFKAMSYKRVL